MRYRGLSIIFLSVFGICFPVFASAELAAHRAVYDITLASSEQNSSVKQASGRLVVEMRLDQCEGWKSTSRLHVKFDDGEGNQNIVDHQYQSVEALDGENFSFKRRSYQDGSDLIEAKEGFAVRKEDGSFNVKEIIEDQQKKTVLEEGVLFPASMSERIIALHEKGKNFEEFKVYDGQDESARAQPVFVTLSKVGENDLEVWDKTLKEQLIRLGQPIKVTMAFFKPDASDEMADYTINTILYKNGVSYSPYFNYGNFILKGTMKILEIFEDKNNLKEQKCL